MGNRCLFGGDCVRACVRARVCVLVLLLLTSSVYFCGGEEGDLT